MKTIVRYLPYALLGFIGGRGITTEHYEIAIATLVIMVLIAGRE